MRSRSFWLAVLLMPLALAACSIRYTNPLQALKASTASPTFSGKQSTPSASTPASSVQDAVPVSGAAPAPICQAASTCAAADAEQIPLSCVKKVPYTNVLVPPGTAFEVLDKSGDFSCIDSGMLLNGKEVITCHGTELFAFQLQLTNPACAGSPLAVGTGQCDDGYGYDAALKCCAPVGDGPAGSTTVTINLGACPLPNNP